MSFGLPIRNGVFVGASSALALSAWSRTSVNDFRVAMPAGATYARTGAATGLTIAETISSFAADVPQRTDRGLALELSRTNLVSRSQEIDLWSKNGTTVLVNETLAPDGTTTGDKVVEVAAASTPRVSRGDLTVVSGTAYVFSIFAKASERDQIRIVTEGSGNFAAYYTLTGAGTVSGVGPLCSGSITALANGWYRCVLTWTAVLTNPSFYVATASGGSTIASGDSSKGVFLWGGQLEAGSFVTSYIQTAAAANTRGLPTFTEPVPAGRSRALLTYADAGNTLVSGLTPGGVFDVALEVTTANKGRSGASELVSRVWYP